MSGAIFATVNAGLSTEQDEKLTRIDEKVDMKSSSIGSGYIG
jgi:hypothetical protein